jgi:hypothetical protein
MSSSVLVDPESSILQTEGGLLNILKNGIQRRRHLFPAPDHDVHATRVLRNRALDLRRFLDQSDRQRDAAFNRFAVNDDFVQALGGRGATSDGFGLFDKGF